MANFKDTVAAIMTAVQEMEIGESQGEAMVWQTKPPTDLNKIYAKAAYLIETAESLNLSRSSELFVGQFVLTEEEGKFKYFFKSADMIQLRGAGIEKQSRSPGVVVAIPRIARWMMIRTQEFDELAPGPTLAEFLVEWQGKIKAATGKSIPAPPVVQAEKEKPVDALDPDDEGSLEPLESLEPSDAAPPDDPDHLSRLTRSKVLDEFYKIVAELRTTIMGQKMLVGWAESYVEKEIHMKKLERFKEESPDMEAPHGG